MIRQSIKSTGPAAPKTTPAPGAVSAVGPKRSPRIASPLMPGKASTRMYGKPEPAPSPNPFTGDVGPGQLGGI